jgi:serine/threonine protein kinase
MIGIGEAPVLSEGAVLGEYRLGQLLGKGATGKVFEATGPTGERVALKVLQRTLFAEHLIERFVVEVQLLRTLDHRGIAKVHDTGTTIVDESPVRWMAMELIEGITLEEYSRQEKLDDEEKLRLLIQICDVVQYAHERGVIHRDLKPSNIMIRDDGTPVLVDFGVALLIDLQGEASERLTLPGLPVGTLAYMSPEQTDGKATAQADVYALGVIFQELLTGQLPIDPTGDSLLGALRRIKEVEPILPRAHRPDLSLSIDAIARMALAKELPQRYVSAEALAADLRLYLAGHTIVLPNQSLVLDLRRRVARNRKALAVVSALLGIAILLGLYARSEEIHARESASEADAAFAAITSNLPYDPYRPNIAGANHETSVARMRELADRTSQRERLADYLTTAGFALDTQKQAGPARDYLSIAKDLRERIAHEAKGQAAVRADLALADTLNRLAWSEVHAGNPLGAVDPARKVLKLRQNRLPPLGDGRPHDDVLCAMADLGQMLRLAKLSDEGEKVFLQMLAAAKGVTGGDAEMRNQIEGLVKDIAADCFAGQQGHADNELRTFLAPLMDQKSRPRIRGRLPWSLAQFAETLYSRGDPDFLKDAAMKIAAVFAADEACMFAKEILPPDHLDIRLCQEARQKLVPIGGVPAVHPTTQRS